MDLSDRCSSTVDNDSRLGRLIWLKITLQKVTGFDQGGIAAKPPLHRTCLQREGYGARLALVIGQSMYDPSRKEVFGTLPIDLRSYLYYNTAYRRIYYVSSLNYYYTICTFARTS